MCLRVLSWEVTGLPIGPEELADALSGWEWDVALLDGVARGWAEVLARSLESELCAAPPARGLRRLLPGGGRTYAVILARYDRVVEHCVGHPPGGWVHAVRLGCGVWIAGAARADADRAEILAREALSWTAGAPLVIALPARPAQRPAEELTPAGHGLFVAGPLRVQASASPPDARFALHHKPPVVEVALPSLGIPS